MAGDGFKRQATRKGTIKLKTLRKPGVKDISSMFNKASTLDEKKLGFADEAGLESLLAMLDHEHPKIRAHAEEMIGNLEVDDGEVVVVDGGYRVCAELLKYKNTSAQRDTLWTLATLAGNTEMNHEGIIVDVGWPTILSRAKAKVMEIQRGAVTLIANLSLNEEMHDMIMEEGGLELLKELADSDDLKLKRAVCNAFANLCSDEENVADVLGDGGLAKIISFLGSGDEELIAGALHTIANVASSDEVQQQIISLGGVEPILNLMKNPNVMILKGASTAMANLAENPEFHKPLMDAGLLDPLIFLARKSKNSEVQFRVVSALNNIAANADYKSTLKDGGAVNPLKSLARSRDPEIKREAIEALAELGITHVKRKKSKAAGADDALAATKERRERERAERERIEREEMEAQMKDKEMREALEKEAREREAAERERIERERVAREKAEAEAREREMRNAAEKEVKEAIQREREKLQKEREEAAQREREAREALERQAEEARKMLEKAKRQTMQIEQLEKERREALEREKREQEEALERAKLQKEELEKQHREALEKEAREAREALERMKREREEFEAAEAARRRAEEEAAEAEAARRGGAMKLVKMNDTYEIEEEKDIYDDYDEEDDEMTDDDKREKAKIALVMVDLWETNEDISITESALRKLGMLAGKERNRKLIRIAGAIPILCEFLRRADPRAGLTSDQSLALQVLAILSRNVRNRVDVQKNDGLKHLLRILKVKEDKDMVECLRALKELAKNDHNKAELRDGRLIEAIVPMILQENQPVQELVLDILTIVSMMDVKSQVIVRDVRGIPALIKLCSHQTDDIRRRAVRCLGAVGQNNRKIQSMVRKAKALDVVVGQLKDANQECKAAAAGAIAALCENDYSNQIAVRKLGAVNLIVMMLASDMSDHVKEQAAVAIRHMAKGNSKIQSDLRGGPGIPALVDLLTADSMGARIHATGAIMEVVRDNNKNCDIVCKAGAPYPLVEALHTENKVLQYMSEGCIWALARKSKQRKTMFREANALEPLRILRGSDHAQVKKGAEWALDVLDG